MEGVGSTVWGYGIYMDRRVGVRPGTDMRGGARPDTYGKAKAGYR